MDKKYEWKKEDKQLYLPKRKPEVIEVGKQLFISIKGTGNPNEATFGEKIGTLYSISYTIKFMPKGGYTPEGYHDFVVFPLEGIWDLVDYALDPNVLDKNNFKYEIMIRQPEFVTKELVEMAIEKAKKKNPSSYYEDVELKEMEDGLCLQMMHVGSFDDELASFAIMDQYLEEHQLERVSKIHKELYISDFRKTKPENLKTVLRYQIKNK